MHRQELSDKVRGTAVPLLEDLRTALRDALPEASVGSSTLENEFYAFAFTLWIAEPGAAGEEVVDLEVGCWGDGAEWHLSADLAFGSEGVLIEGPGFRGPVEKLGEAELDDWLAALVVFVRSAQGPAIRAWKRWNSARPV